MAAACSGKTGGFSFKASDRAFELLIEAGVGPSAPYLAGAKGVKLTEPLQQTQAALRAYRVQAHHLVADKLTRGVRAKLGL